MDASVEHKCGEDIEPLQECSGGVGGFPQSERVVRNEVRASLSPSSLSLTHTQWNLDYNFSPLCYWELEHLNVIKRCGQCAIISFYLLSNVHCRGVNIILREERNCTYHVKCRFK